MKQVKYINLKIQRTVQIKQPVNSQLVIIMHHASCILLPASLPSLGSLVKPTEGFPVGQTPLTQSISC